MNPISVINDWSDKKLQDIFYGIKIFMEYLFVDRDDYKLENKNITLEHVKYVVEDIYGCKIECEKCVLDVPEYFIDMCKKYFSPLGMHIKKESIDYIFKWITELAKMLADKNIVEYLKEMKPIMKRKIYDMIKKKRQLTDADYEEKTRRRVQELELFGEDEAEKKPQIYVKGKPVFPKWMSKEEKLEEIHNLDADKVINAKKEELRNLMKRQRDIPEEAEKEGLEADIETLKSEIEDYIAELDTSDIKYKRNPNADMFREESRLDFERRNVGRGKMDIVSPKSRAFRHEKSKVDLDINAEIDRIDKLKPEDFGPEYALYIKNRIHLFQHLTIPPKNFGLNRESENYAVGSISHIFSKLTAWFDSSVVGRNEVNACVKILIGDRSVSSSSVDVEDHVVKTLIKNLSSYNLTINTETIPGLGTVLNNLDNEHVNRRVQYFSKSEVSTEKRDLKKSKHDMIAPWFKKASAAPFRQKVTAKYEPVYKTYDAKIKKTKPMSKNFNASVFAKPDAKMTRAEKLEQISELRRQEEEKWTDDFAGEYGASHDVDEIKRKQKKTL